MSRCPIQCSDILIICPCLSGPLNCSSIFARKSTEALMEPRTMAIRRRPGRSSASRAGHHATNYLRRKLNWRIRGSLFAPGKVAGIAATCLQLPFTASMSAMASWMSLPQARPRGSGEKIRIGNPNSALLSPAWRVTWRRNEQNRTCCNPYLVSVRPVFAVLVTRHAGTFLVSTMWVGRNR